MHKDWQEFLKENAFNSRPDEANILIHLSDYGLLKVSGVDAKKFLQGQLTCDLNEVTEIEHRMGAHCNPQGRVISLFRLFQRQNAYYLFMLRSMVPLALAALKKYAVFYKTELNDESDHLITMGYAGKILENIDVTNSVSVVKIPSSPPRFVFIGEIETVKNSWKKLAPHSRIHASSAFHLLDILDGIPRIYPQTSGKFLPHELNLSEQMAVSFTKGCYTGQEIIARMQYRGKPKKHLYRAEITHKTALLPGSTLYHRDNLDTHPGGILVDACHEAYHNYQALIVTDESNAKNNHLFLDREEQVFLTIFA